MKKIFLASILGLFLLTACGIDEITKTEETKVESKLKEEIKKEAEIIRDDVYYAKDLKKNSKVSEKFKLINDITYDTDGLTKSYDISLECNDFVEGSFHFDTENQYFYFVPSEDIVDRLIVLDDKESDKTVDVSFLKKGDIIGVNLSDVILAEDFIVYLEYNDAHKLDGKLYIKTLRFFENEIEGGSDLIGNEFVPTDKEIENVLGKTIGNDENTDEIAGTLSRFGDEYITSEYKDFYVEYDKYHLVILPAQETIVNRFDLTKRDVIIHEDANREFGHEISILGEVSSLTLTYDSNNFDDVENEKVITIDGPIKDELITVYANWPTDTSSILVEGMYIYNSGIDGFSFSIDSVRDIEAYKILMFEKSENNTTY